MCSWTRSEVHSTTVALPIRRFCDGDFKLARLPFSDTSYTATTFSLEQGDRILLITDGIIEAKNSTDNEFGMERLRKIVELNHDLPVSHFADVLLGELSRWSGDALESGQSDDITLIAIDFKGISSQAA